MTSISDQFSAVRKAQFDFFNAIASQTLESASRMAALNLAASRDAVQRSIGATFALANARDPRDVLSLGGQAEQQFRSLFAYGRELLGIAAAVRPYAMRPQALSAPPAIETVDVVERSVARAASDAAVESGAEAAVQATPAVQAAHPVAAFAPVTEPVVVAEPEAAPAAGAEALAAEPVPVAEPKAIAKAVGKGAAHAAAAPHPAAAPVAGLATDEGAEAPKLVPAPAVSKRKK